MHPMIFGDGMNILVVFTGGTIACSENGGALSPDNKNSALLLNMYTSIDKNVKFTPIQPYSILSENLMAENLVALYNCIKSYDLSQFDGVIVAHGTDTLQYTASFLSYTFGLCNMPIVLVSANYPLMDVRSNGFENFCGAVYFIKAKSGKGVFVSYKNTGESLKIHRASRLLAHSAYSDSVFSVFDAHYGEISENTFIKNIDYKELEYEIDFSDKVENISSSKVLKINPYVGFVYPDLDDLGVKAVLLEGYHSGTLNTENRDLKEFCENAQRLNIPVFLTGACKGFFYESKLMFDKLKIKVLPPASPIAMYIKLWLADENDFDGIYQPAGGDFFEKI